MSIVNVHDQYRVWNICRSADLIQVLLDII